MHNLSIVENILTGTLALFAKLGDKLIGWKVGWPHEPVIAGFLAGVEAPGSVPGFWRQKVVPRF